MVYLIEIDEGKCNGDGECIEICPVQVLELQGSESKKAVAVHPEECTGCMACVSVCQHSAITVTEI